MKQYFLIYQMGINRLLLFTLFSFLTFVVNAQDSTSVEIEFTDNQLRLNEIKLNLGYTLLGFPEISYERILNDNSSIGLSIAYGFNIDDLEYKYLIHPYYRLFFSQKPAAGFFFEGVGVIFEELDVYNFNIREDEDVKGAGLGISIGIKLLNENGWTGELLAGFSRNLTSTENINVSEFIPRFGISIGKRFY